MKIKISEDILKFTALSDKEITLEIAIMLYKKQKITLGQVGLLTKLHQYQFQKDSFKKDLANLFILNQIKFRNKTYIIMETLKNKRYITNRKGKTTDVILDLKTFEKIQVDLEEFYLIKEYDKAVKKQKENLRKVSSAAGKIF